MRILTFDVEDWFHILDNESTRDARGWDRFESRVEAGTDRILQILEETGSRATFFCLGWVAERHPAVVRKIADAGFEVASHSSSHRLLYELSPADFAADLERSIEVLQQSTGTAVRAYRAPGFSLTPDNTWVFDALIEQGIQIDCSIFPAVRPHGGFAGFGTARPVLVHAEGGVLKEFPINVQTLLGARFVFSGGGYFRLLPYRLIRTWSRRSEYLMTYFHPRDFDPDQPLLEGLGWVKRFRAYHGLKRSEDKLRRLLSDFRFIDLAAADAATDWSGVGTWKLP